MGKPCFTGFTEIDCHQVNYHICFLMLTLKDTLKNRQSLNDEAFLEQFTSLFICNKKTRQAFETELQQAVVDNKPGDFEPYHLRQKHMGYQSIEFRNTLNGGSEMHAPYEPGHTGVAGTSNFVSPPTHRELIGLIHEHYEVIKESIGYGEVDNLWGEPSIDISKFPEVVCYSEKELPILIREVIRRADHIPYQFFQDRIRLIQEVQRYESYLQMKRDIAAGIDIGFDPDNV
ncbi:hypothetical protein JKG47_10250 [Acidithiobacillus sp. MC6.1]|nr:hypothetical protein [Acidithiobacillus sp. MC6.1]